jgi:hypothetical protein
MNEFREITNGEVSRTYLFSKERSVKFENVARVSVSASNTHRLETVDGKKFIVNPGWLAIEIEASEWSF